ncbi:MAG: T9SS type A sorting domain-containing protein [Bacteroidales bacterium]|nr:T9SS type A sorting domain-containing protein [Bacteroidales bacterium]
MKKLSAIVFILLFATSSMFAKTMVMSGIDNLQGNPILVPGTVAASQNIAYNTAPQLLTATPPTGGTPPYSYMWQSSLDNDTFQNISGGTALIYQPGALTVTTFYRQVQYSSGKVDSAYTNTITIHVYGLSVDDLVQSNHRVYPNPTTSSITLEILGKNPFEKIFVELYDVKGDKVLSEFRMGSDKYKLSLAPFPAGIYFLKVKSSDKQETVRVIKQ